jgi:hypothetical protein
MAADAAFGGADGHELLIRGAGNFEVLVESRRAQCDFVA